MKSGYDLSRTVTVTRAVLIPADPNRTALRITSGLVAQLTISTRAEDGSGGFIIHPNTPSEIFKLG